MVGFCLNVHSFHIFIRNFSRRGVLFYLATFEPISRALADNPGCLQTCADAAERLLTLLGMDEGNEDLLSSSEDEGVEVDIDELEDDDEESENTKLLHQLAVSLAQELKYSQQRSPSSSSGRAAHQGRSSTLVEMLHEGTSYHDRGCLQDQANPKSVASVYQNDLFVHDNLDGRNTVGRTKLASFGNFCQERQQPHSGSFEPKDTANLGFAGYMNLDRRLRMDDPDSATQSGKSFDQQEQDSGTWSAGWDACATEALRYLVEDEGLPLHHPTVIAMKNHLDLQRERAFAQYTGYTEAKSQDMSLALD